MQPDILDQRLVEAHARQIKDSTIEQNAEHSEEDHRNAGALMPIISALRWARKFFELPVPERELSLLITMSNQLDSWYGKQKNP